jgi:hypothetical protein
MPKPDFSKLPFWILLSGVSLALILLIGATLFSPRIYAPEGAEVTDSLSREVIKVRYYKDAKALVDQYLGEIGPLSELMVDSPYFETTKAAKNHALELLVPAEAKSFHLDLVIALNFMEKGFGGDEPSLAEGVQRFRILLEDNDWLSD